MVRKAIAITLLTFAADGVFGQNVRDSVIFAALNDELWRNMKELSYEGFDKPFYISYSIDDVRQHELVASMGALLRSANNHSRLKNVRVLVGDYDFNDESLDNNTYTPGEPSEIELPLDDDYYGIRRSFWVTTDYVYKGAARQYKKNLETLKETGKSLAELPHRSFARKPPVRIIRREKEYVFEMTALEQYIRAISAEISSYPGVEYSNAYLTFRDGYTYFVNSEGTVSMTPVQQASLHIFAQRKTPDGQTIQERITHFGLTPDHLPTLEALRPQIARLAAYISAPPSAKLEEEYSGPVLVADKAVADMFLNAFGADVLTASEILPDPRGQRITDQSASLENKIGKTVVSPLINVKATASRREFGGTTLLGAYDIDNEGVVPDDEMVVIERGILRNLFNDRSLIRKDIETANGHADGNGILDVYVTNGHSLKKLTEQLVEEAKRQGLDHAMFITDSLNVPGGPWAIILPVDGGAETVKRSPVLEFISLKGLKEGIAGTSEQKAFNLSHSDEGVTSIIVPGAVLLREADVRASRTNLFREEKYISKPFH